MAARFDVCDLCSAFPRRIVPIGAPPATTPRLRACERCLVGALATLLDDDRAAAALIADAPALLDALLDVVLHHQGRCGPCAGCRTANELLVRHGRVA